MKKVLITLSFFLMIGCHAPSPSELQVAGRKVGTLKGLEALRDQMRSRLFPAGSSRELDLRKFLSEDPEESAGLSFLLGAFNQIAGYSFQERATPNPVNAFLWEIVSEGISNELAVEICSGTKSTFEPKFFSAALALCKTSDPTAARNLWMSVMRYDAPEAELNLWMQEESAADGILQVEKDEARLAALLHSIFMNPYFILEQ